MSIVVIGGVDHNRSFYRQEAERLGCKAKFFTGHERNFSRHLGEQDLIIIFTNCVSHKARCLAMRHAKANSVPVKMIHAKGINSLSLALTEAI